jgi:hypothetical protein
MRIRKLVQNGRITAITSACRAPRRETADAIGDGVADQEQDGGGHAGQPQAGEVGVEVEAIPGEPAIGLSVEASEKGPHAGQPLAPVNPRRIGRDRQRRVAERQLGHQRERKAKNTASHRKGRIAARPERLPLIV